AMTTTLLPATRPRSQPLRHKLLVVDRDHGRFDDARVGDLPKYLRAGDLVVVNDAATLPASLVGKTKRGASVEARLADVPLHRSARAILFGAGDWHERTEERAAPPKLAAGDTIAFDGLAATILRVDEKSPRLVELFFDRDGDALWRALFRAGRPIQYSYLDRELSLWDVQTPFASRPFAVEMPSAGRPLAWSVIRALEAKGVEIARLSHAAGLSSSGDATLDARLPFAERYDVPRVTIDAIAKAKREGKRVVAIGTTVVRALEGNAAKNDGVLVPGEGVTDLLLDANHRPRVVDAVLSGMHEPGTSHFHLLEAFAPSALLAQAIDHAFERGYVSHEFGDSCLIGPMPR
ncbi:MAG TPA: S-adenosylmethionine:tRNA ribosyltransferase-isomerase, partial [Polyangiaceae bacterium]